MEEKSAQVYNNKSKSYNIPEDIVARASENPCLSNLIVTKSGYFERCFGHGIKRDGISEFIIIYCVNGKGWYTGEEVSEHIKKGEMLFIEAGRKHSYGADNNDPWTIYWAHFRGNAVNELYKLLGVNSRNNVLTFGDQPEIKDLFDRIFLSMTGGYNFPGLFYASTCLQEILALLIRYRNFSINGTNNGRDIESAIDYMLQRLNQQLDLEQISEYVNVSKFHFMRIFKTKTGYPPMEYFNRLKIQKACELLETTALSVKEISNILAFGNQYYFSEVFKKITGHSPRNYRQLKKEKLAL